MNNAETFPVDVEEQRAWINAEKAARHLSWPALAKLVGLPSGTLSPFATGTYRGAGDRIAREIFKFRQTVSSQAVRSIGVAQDPGYFETPTALRFRMLMIVAHMGRMTVGATGPGTGKTVAMREYQASTSNCWRVTMWESDKTLKSMIEKVLRALGESPKRGSTADLSRQVSEKVRGKRGLLVVDEANHLSTEQLETIRAWHDEDEGPGVCLFGNEELLFRIESGARQDAYGRINSRIAQRLIQNLPLAEDVECFCEAWQLTEAAMVDMLRRVAMTPGAGGLRECRQIVEQASMLAADDDRPLTLADLRDAQAGRATRFIRTA